MILPTKHIPAEHTLLGVGAVVLGNMTEASTVSAVWHRVRKHAAVGTFDRYVLALDLLYVLGMVEIREDGLLVRSEV